MKYYDFKFYNFNTQKKFAFLLLCSLFLSISLHAHPKSFSSIVKSERKKIVHISTSSKIQLRNGSPNPFFDRFFEELPKEKRQFALGSGFLISEDGYIVTNNHIVEKADKVDVILFDDRKFKDVKVIGRDPRTDLALIKIDAEDLPFVSYGDDSKLEIGDWVLAIGNPLGLDHTVTSGILSARGRDIFGGTAYGQFLQTDAAINPGNSGGPLFNIKGEVIGINTAIVAGGQGLGFAVPINLARKVIDQLEKHGKVRRGWFGVGIQSVGYELAESFGMPKGSRGVAITSVSPDSPAEKAGLKDGDILVEFEGKPLIKTTDLQQYVAETTPDTTIIVKVFRDQKFLNIKVKVGLAPDEPFSFEKKNKTSELLGLHLIEINPTNKNQLPVRESKGLYVKKVILDSKAWEAGIRQGDVIIEINRTSIETIQEFMKIIDDEKDERNKIPVTIKRNGSITYVPLPIK